MARVSDLLAAGRTFSFEFFPPQTDSAQLSLGHTIAELEPLDPSFVSVTYGAGGSSRQRTREVVTWVRKETAITPMAHLTCQGHARAEIREILDDYRTAGIENILALGGDLPGEPADARPSDYTYACDLLDDIAGDDFSIGVAAHPEVHPKSPDRDTDRQHLAAKLRRADFAITQVFFGWENYVRLRDAVAARGCDVPIVPGVMPVTNVAQVERFAVLTGMEFPADIADRLRAAPDDLDEVRRIGVDVATGLCDRLLAEGAPGLHFITLNRSTSTREVWRNLRVGAHV